MQRYTAESAGVCASADALAHAIQRYEVPPHIASEFAELAAVCRQQHGVILSGPLRLQSARLEALAQDLRAPMIGSSVAAALQPPTAAGNMPLIGQLAEEGGNPVVQPGHDTVSLSQAHRRRCPHGELHLPAFQQGLAQGWIQDSSLG